MSKTNEPTAPKQPKTVQVKMLVPYAIIVAMALIVASTAVGWFGRSNFDATIKSEVMSQVTELKKAEQK